MLAGFQRFLTWFIIFGILTFSPAFSLSGEILECEDECQSEVAEVSQPDTSNIGAMLYRYGSAVSDPRIQLSGFDSIPVDVSSVKGFFSSGCARYDVYMLGTALSQGQESFLTLRLTI